MGCLVASLSATPAAAEVSFRLQWPGAGDGFANPGDLATDRDGNVYVADTGDDEVQAYTNTGAFLHEWGSTGTGSSELDGPEGIALGPQDLVYVVDTGNDRVQ